MISNPNRQQGMTMIAWVIILAIVGFFTLIAVRLTPAYLENYSVKSALEAMKSDPDLARASTQELGGRLLAHFNINYISTVPLDKIKIKKVGAVTKIDIEYEVRVPILGNVDAVMSFDEHVELTPR